MGIATFFTSKIFIGVMGGAAVIGGLAWTGGDAINNAMQTMGVLGDEHVSYEANENKLVGMITSVTKSANEKIKAANDIISGKNGEITKLNGDNTTLKSNVDQLQKDIAANLAQLEDVKGQLTAKNGELEQSKGQSAALQAELDDKIKSLTVAQDSIKTLSAQIEQLSNDKSALTNQNAELSAAKDALAKENAKLKDDISWGVNKAKEVDKQVKGLEGEITKANDQAEDLNVKTNEVKSSTEAAKPMTQAEVDAIDTNTTDVAQ
jgi:chromosome segregation ATPase